MGGRRQQAHRQAAPDHQRCEHASHGRYRIPGGDQGASRLQIHAGRHVDHRSRRGQEKPRSELGAKAWLIKPFQAELWLRRFPSSFHPDEAHSAHRCGVRGGPRARDASGRHQFDGIQENAGGQPLGKRLHHFNFSSFRQYLNWLNDSRSGEELQVSLDLLTTNETYFFREPKHFEFLRTAVLPQYKGTRTLRVWSAACSSGEEPYSLAMLLAAELPHSNWRCWARTSAPRARKRAHRAVRRFARQAYSARVLQRFCLKGIGHRKANC